MTTPFDLGDKVAIVVGSRRGIGRGSAEAMARLGAKVVVFGDARPTPAKRWARGIRESGGEAAVVPCNISHKDEAAALLAETLCIDVVGLPASVHQSAGLRHVRPSGSQRAWG